MKAFVLVPHIKNQKSRRGPDSRLAELVGLAQALDIEVVSEAVVHLNAIKTATYIGSGKVEELAPLLADLEVDWVIIDAHLNPGQQRNLERQWKDVRVVDRVWLILEIFAKRARTNEARLQVELACLLYQKSHLVRSWTHLERQRAGGGFLGGSGEKQLELDRRSIDEKIVRLEKQLKQVERTRTLHRKTRQKTPFPIIALVGYTNAGKSTLFNRLTGSHVLAQDILFATLDPTMRLVKLPSGRKVILSDTVGFISDLPTSLIAAFRSTLEEVLEARIVLLVEDCSHPEVALQRKDVQETLEALGIDTTRQNLVHVYNKIDKLTHVVLPQEEGGEPIFPISALTGEGIPNLLAHCDTILRHEADLFELQIPTSVAGKVLAWLHENGEVLMQKNKWKSERETVYAFLTPPKRAQLEKIFQI